MSWLQPLAVVVHVLLAFGIIALVLLQRGKGADAGAGFGAGASGTVFGARRLRVVPVADYGGAGYAFLPSSLALSYLFSHGAVPTSVMDRVATEQTQPADGATKTGEPEAPAVDVPVAPATSTPVLPATDGPPAAPAEAPAGQ